MMFPFTQIAVTALVGAAVSAVAVVLYSRATKDPPQAGRSASILGVIVGLSILAWRAAGNTAALNEDPIAFISPNDLLCPVVTYVSVSLYGGLANMSGGPGWARLRALLTFISLIVNVVMI